MNQELAARADLKADLPERLQARQVVVHFVGVKALDGIDLVLLRGELLGLIGPNGAGKTTLVNVISGLQRPNAGTVSIGKDDVTRLPPYRIARLGVGRTFQGIRSFKGLTVLENVEAGAVGAGIGRQEARRIASELLERMGLSNRAHERPDSLPPGLERRLGIIRALALRPHFLLLDEPGAGLNEAETDELLKAIVMIRNDFGCGVLIIEHNMRLIMRLCERIQVLDHGKTISIGAPEVVRSDPAVIDAYLGTKKEIANAPH